MLTQSIIPTLYRGERCVSVSWDGDPKAVSEAKLAWIRLIVAHHNKDANRVSSCATALRRHFTAHGLMPDEVDAAIIAARETVELIERTP